jgi:hypothetical protein
MGPAEGASGRVVSCGRQGRWRGARIKTSLFVALVVCILLARCVSVDFSSLYGHRQKAARRQEELIIISNISNDALSVPIHARCAAPEWG